jgi:hypothetical protein
MKTFLQRFGALVLGVLCGFDRIRFRGGKRQLCYPEGITWFLREQQIAPGQFKTYAQDVTEALFQAIEPSAKKLGIYQYLKSKQTRPEKAALAIAAEHGKKTGLIAVLGRVEPCQTLAWRKDKNGWSSPYLLSGAKCLHYYHYYLDPDFGLRYTRLQTWFPFTMHVGLNGRDWLARQMTHAGIGFTQKDNCFSWVQDFAAAQRLLDAQLSTKWPKLLNAWAQQSNPLEQTFLGKPMPYYWTIQEGEYATDVVFRSPEDLARLYPSWLQYASSSLQSRDLMRFMSYRLRQDGVPIKAGEVRTTVKELTEGMCVRHWVLNNLLKMYDKKGSILRLETLLRDVYHFSVFRSSEGSGGDKRYMPLRKGVADIHRRAEISSKINGRYLEALATVAEPKPLEQLIKPLGKRASWKGRLVRAVNAFSEHDARLLETVQRGEFMIQGFRNKDIRAILFPTAGVIVPEEQKRQSAQVTRRLIMLRAHGLIARVSKTLRYQVTEKGRAIISAVLAARKANTELLLKAA